MRVSFSQYAEDIILTHMVPQRDGFYVDVGAFEPRSGSNTYKLYLKGWSGITIEPNPDVAKSFLKTRPRDTHLPIGVAKSASELTYHKSAQANVNSFNPEWQQQLGFAVMERLPIKCASLTDVFDEHCPNRQVDLLSIDCEGSDLEVVESLDWSRYRPSVVIVEDFAAFESGMRAAGSSAIRSFMLERDYALASQAVFSCFYVDRHAFHPTGRNVGFRLDRSQLGGLGFP